jgi:hypothetical protein
MEALKEVPQAKWAADIGVHVKTVQDWVRFVRETGGLTGAAAPSQAYEDWYQNTRRDDGDRAVSSARNLVPERKAALIVELISDPEYGAEVWAMVLQATRKTKTREQKAPGGQQPTVVGILNDMIGAKRFLQDAFKSTVKLSPGAEAKDKLLGGLGEVDAEADNLRGLLTGMSLDEAIERAMEGS